MRLQLVTLPNGSQWLFEVEDGKIRHIVKYHSQPVNNEYEWHVNAEFVEALAQVKLS